MSISSREPLQEKIGGLLFGLSIVFCSMEMVPRWSVLNLQWPPIAFIGLMGVCGAVSGWLLASHHRLPGLCGGLFAGPGALLAIAFVLERTTWTHTLIVMAVGAIGALPGLGLYGILAWVERALAPPLEEGSKKDVR